MIDISFSANNLCSLIIFILGYKYPLCYGCLLFDPIMKIFFSILERDFHFLCPRERFYLTVSAAWLLEWSVVKAL